MNAQRFKTLVINYHRQLYRTAFFMLGNMEDAEDAVQDTYLKLWKVRDSLDTTTNLEAYCKSALRRVCFDKMRANRLDMSVEIGDIAETHYASENCERMVETRNEMDYLYEALRQLPQGQRMVIFMRDIEDCTMEEICETSGFSESNIRSMLSRGRKSIKDYIKKVFDYGIA